MSAFETSTIQIENLEHFEKALNEADPHHHERRFWRGQKDCSWGLQPGVFRAPRHYHESTLLRDFRLRAETLTERPPLREDYVGWINFAQHYGLPTRLLDWTVNPIVGLFFAVWDDQKEEHDGALWSLDAAGLNEAQKGRRGLLLPDDQDVVAMVMAAFGSGAHAAPLPSVLAFAPFESDVRMVAQRSSFTIHGDDADLAELDVVKGRLLKWKIPHDSKGFLRRRLRAIGVSRSTVFPDLAHLADDLRLFYDEFQYIEKLLRDRGEVS